MYNHEQVINIDMNWNDEMSSKEMDARNAEAEIKAIEIVNIIRDPSKGIHAYHYETMCGWAVLVSHNVMTMGEGDLKRASFDAGLTWHRGRVSRVAARAMLLDHGKSCDEVDRLIANADKSPDDVRVPQ